MTYLIIDHGRAFLCGHCGRISHNPNDVAERFCGACKVFHPEQEPTTSADRLLMDMVTTLRFFEPVFFRQLVDQVRDCETIATITDWLEADPYRNVGRTVVAQTIAEWLIANRKGGHG